MNANAQSKVRIEPIISYPHEALVGETYLMTIDLRMKTNLDDWPYDEEEYPVLFILDTQPYFNYEPVGESDPSVVLHRFGGTYGPARFLLTAAQGEMTGEIHIHMLNKWGIPLEQITVKSKITVDAIIEQNRIESNAKSAKELQSLKRLIPKIGQDENVEFERLTKADLKSVPVFAQALDNQWLPRSLLEQAQKAKEGAKKIDKQLRKLVRAEYIRSLINGQQVVINRAFIYNNPAISQDYAHKDSPEREAFKALLAEGTIILSLYLEESPIERPAFDVLEEPFARWQELCTEVRTHCIRLSWDKKANERLSRDLLAKRFHTFILGAPAGDMDTYLADLGLDPSMKDAFRRRLVELGRVCLDLSSQGKLVTRNILYKAFVTAGKDPSQRQYDSSPIAGAIKQLLDVAYNRNLPDALDGYLITPVDTLARTALQEWVWVVQRPLITGEELLTLLQRTAFDFVQRGLNVKSMDVLRLQDVREIRNMDEWRGYIESLEALLRHPERFADGGATRVYQSYVRLTKRITDLISAQERKDKDQVLTSWRPTIELIFNIAGAVLTWRSTETGPIWRLRGKVVEQLAGETAPVVGKLVIRDMSEEQSQQDLSTGIDFMRFMMPNVQEEWEEIERTVRKLPGFQETPGFLKEIVDSTLSYREPENGV